MSKDTLSTTLAEYREAIKAEKAGDTRKANAVEAQGILAHAAGPEFGAWLDIEGNTLDLGVDAFGVERSRLNRVATMGAISRNLDTPANDDDSAALQDVWKVVRSARGLKAAERDELAGAGVTTWAGLADAVKAITSRKPAKRVSDYAKVIAKAVEALQDLDPYSADADDIESLAESIEGLQAFLNAAGEEEDAA